VYRAGGSVPTGGPPERPAAAPALGSCV